MKKTYIVKVGCGCWDTTNFPYGGKFHRVSFPLLIKAVRVTQIYSTGEPSEIEGTTEDGRKICVGTQVCYQFS